MGRQPAFFICLGAVLACGTWMFAQAPSKPATEGEPKTKPAGDAKPAGELEQFLKERGYTAIPLERYRCGNIVVVVSIGETKLRLVCDTGAPLSMLDEKRTKELRIDWEKSDYNMPAGESDFAKSCRIEVVGLNAIKMHGIRFHSFDAANGNKVLERWNDPPVDGLLGYDVLKDYSAIIDIRALRLYLRVRS